MLETKNILKKASLSLIAAALFALNGCSSDYFDSSIGPDGKKIQFDNNLKPTKSAPQKKQPSKQAPKVEAKKSDTAKAPSVTDTEGNTLCWASSGTQGIGVFIMDSPNSALSVLQKTTQMFQ